MLSFNVLDDLKEARDVLSNFIEQADTKEVIEKSVQMMVSSIKNGGKIISAGNGGSMCDAMHFAEELTGRYRNNRPSYPAIAISDVSHMSCVGNDYGYDYVFSRFLEGMGFKNDVFLRHFHAETRDHIVDSLFVLVVVFAHDRFLHILCIGQIFVPAAREKKKIRVNLIRILCV